MQMHHTVFLFHYLQHLDSECIHFLLGYIHFLDSSKQKRQGQAGYNPLFKVAEIVRMISVAMRAVWLPGEKITIDKRMIRYHNQAIVFVHYMPRKPI